LNLWYQVRVGSQTDVAALADELNLLDIVEIAYPAALPAGSRHRAL
jgi:hypothetical protein